MKKIKGGNTEYTQVMVLDEPGAGGACHLYQVLEDGCDIGYYANVQFQNGPIK